MLKHPVNTLIISMYFLNVYYAGNKGQLYNNLTIMLFSLHEFINSILAKMPCMCNSTFIFNYHYYNMCLLEKLTSAVNFQLTECYSTCPDYIELE